MAVSSSVRVRAAALSSSFLSGHRLVAVQRRVDEVVLGDADGVDDDEPGLGRSASGVTAWKSAGAMVRAPRPFICSKYCAERTSRMKNTHSSGLTSVPVAIMSTVTAMRRVGEVRNACSCPLGSLAL